MDQVVRSVVSWRRRKPLLYDFRFVFRPSENRKCCKTIVYNTKQNKCCGNDVLLKADETCEIRSWFINMTPSSAYAYHGLPWSFCGQLVLKVLKQKTAGKCSRDSLVLSFESYCNLSQFGLDKINSLALIFLHESSWNSTSSSFLSGSFWSIQTLKLWSGLGFEGLVSGNILKERWRNW